MKRKIFTLIFLLNVVPLTAYGSFPQTFVYEKNIPESFDARRLEKLDLVFEKMVEDGTIPHAVTFVARRGQVVHSKAYGWRDREAKIPCRRDDFFRLASQTKAITAVAVMTLFEDGKILLDDPIKKYIPEFSNPRVLVAINKDSTYRSSPAKKDITIRHLLTHTSGIPYEGSQDIRKVYRKKNFPIMPLVSLENVSLEEVVKKIASCPLVHEPGESFTYGMSTDVLGYLIEVVSGLPVDEYLAKVIFEPLGMNNTFFSLPKKKSGRLVALYQKDRGRMLQKNSNVVLQTYPYAGKQRLFSTGAGLVGTIEDYAKFCQMILNGGTFNGARILSRKTIDLMKRNQVNDFRGDIGFGLAWDTFRPEYVKATILSEGSLRWGGMFGTDYVIDPKEETILLFYINLYPNRTGIDFKTLFHNLVYQAIL